MRHIHKDRDFFSESYVLSYLVPNYGTLRDSPLLITTMIIV